MIGSKDVLSNTSKKVSNTTNGFWEINSDPRFVHADSHVMDDYTAMTIIPQRQNKMVKPRTSLCDLDSTSTSMILNWDEGLFNKPREAFIKTILELSNGSEEPIVLYRTSLLGRTGTIPNCPKGKLITRKTTNKSTSVFKYA